MVGPREGQLNVNPLQNQYLSHGQFPGSGPGVGAPQPGMAQPGAQSGIAQMGTPPSLSVGSPLAQPGSVGGPIGVSTVGPMGPQSVGGGGPNSSVGTPASSVTLSNTNQQANSIPHLGPMRGSSPSPAHSRSPTPHQTPPRLAGSQTPQPHTPNAPQLAPLSLQQNQLSQGPGSNKPLQPQHLGPSGSTTPSHPGLASSLTPHAGQLPRTPVSQYQDPWQYVDDIWLMFNNAWLYNRKTSRVYKFCSKLAEVFEQEIDPVMQGLGYCCGRKVR
ncbi:hypothetical protein GOODEAATRI_001169 [Goodea atripinnis]|uniref:Bromo domain-containing protein n=1 Tax=Goodea atripinnis TaxID=208336 RepID=A0ABV0NA74_9TELE